MKQNPSQRLRVVRDRTNITTGKGERRGKKHKKKLVGNSPRPRDTVIWDDGGLRSECESTIELIQ